MSSPPISVVVADAPIAFGDMNINFKVNTDVMEGPYSDEDEENFEEYKAHKSNVKVSLDDVANKLSQLQFGVNFENMEQSEGFSHIVPSSSVPCNTMLSDSDSDEVIEGAEILQD